MSKVKLLFHIDTNAVDAGLQRVFTSFSYTLFAFGFLFTVKLNKVNSGWPKTLHIQLSLISLRDLKTEYPCFLLYVFDSNDLKCCVL